MPRHHFVLLIGLLAGSLPAHGLAAQQPVAATAPAGCTYATCALRVEPRFWVPARLVRGAAGVEVGRLGGFGGGVDTLLAGPDSAAAYARGYVKAARTSSVLGLAGAVAYVVVLWRTDNFRDDIDNTSVAAGLAGVGFAIASIPFVLRAQRDLSRAVWWYNAALPR
jgi:hypothetical protein